LKISLNSDHTSRGYGFVCFKDEDAASKALEASSEADSVQAVKFEPKDRREIRKLINNIYVKNIPLDYSDSQVKELFAPFGEIKSLVLNKNDMGQFGFVCYDDPQGYLRNTVQSAPRRPSKASKVESWVWVQTIKKSSFTSEPP